MQELTQKTQEICERNAALQATQQLLLQKDSLIEAQSATILAREKALAEIEQSTLQELTQKTQEICEHTAALQAVQKQLLQKDSLIKMQAASVHAYEKALAEVEHDSLQKQSEIEQALSEHMAALQSTQQQLLQKDSQIERLAATINALRDASTHAVQAAQQYRTEKEQSQAIYVNRERTLSAQIEELTFTKELEEEEHQKHLQKVEMEWQTKCANLQLILENHKRDLQLQTSALIEEKRVLANELEQAKGNYDQAVQRLSDITSEDALLHNKLRQECAEKTSSEELLEQKFKQEEMLKRRYEAMYQQLQLQFKEKSRVLDETRKELFFAHENAFVIEREKHEAFETEVNVYRLAFEKHIASIDRELKIAETAHNKETQTLHELISTLLIQMQNQTLSNPQTRK